MNDWDKAYMNKRNADPTPEPDEDEDEDLLWFIATVVVGVVATAFVAVWLLKLI